GNTSRYSYNDAESINRIDVSDVACEEYPQEVLGFSGNFESDNPTSTCEPIIANSSPSLTPFKGGDFVLEEIEAYLTSDSIPSRIDDAEFDPDGDIRLIKEILNKDMHSPLPSNDLNITSSESEELSDNRSECDVPVCDDSSPYLTTFSNHLFDSNDDFTYSDNESFSEEDVLKENFKINSNPHFKFDEEIIYSKIDLLYNEIHSIPQGNDNDHFNAESDLIESLLNQDTLMVSSPKIDSLLEEFSGELAHINLIPPRIDEANFDPEEDIRPVEKLLYDNSSPRPPEERNSKISDAIIESFSPSPILVEDSDYLMEKIDIFLALDDSIPSGIENAGYDSERDILFLEELLTHDSLS
nr:reverse transcriptase domain-containing protein [Tanacetum cinerariifolium]